MSIRKFVAFIALLAIFLFLRLGVSFDTVIAISAGALIATVPWYFGTRDRSAEPSAFEYVAANAWVWFRRLVGLGAGSFFIWTSWHVLDSNIILAGTIAALGLFCIYAGIVGQGSNRAAFQDDLALHRDNKHRYKWWF